MENERTPKIPSALLHSTHARHSDYVDPPFTLDSALHVSRYRWAASHWIEGSDEVVDLGCGTGSGARLIATYCRAVVGVDLMPSAPEIGTGSPAPDIGYVSADASHVDLLGALPSAQFDIVLSMETLEHIEDYFTYLSNAAALVREGGTVIIATPNRRMTFERYPGRQHMDESHVQEFTLVALEGILENYFAKVQIYFQCVPGFWSAPPPPPPVTANALRSLARDWLPPKVVRALRQKSAPAESKRKPLYELDEVQFVPVTEAKELEFDAFGLVAVCRAPIRPGVPTARGAW